ncbi:MAG: BON domain-containing protein [Methylotenera sp.]|nr:BON domain-containing protein [Methylotenera sp.]MDD4925608.1 BON domain-containing protein [Methylotenera sp.]
MKTHIKLFILSAVFVGLNILTGCNKPQETTSTTASASMINAEVSDNQVTTNVKTALLLDEKIKDFDIAVVALKGDVRLSGVVDSQDQIDYVTKLVRNVAGVHSIHDELQINQAK